MTITKTSDFCLQNAHIHHPDNDIIGNEGLSRLEMDFPLAYFITAYTDARNFGANFSSSFSDLVISCCNQSFCSQQSSALTMPTAFTSIQRFMFTISHITYHNAYCVHLDSKVYTLSSYSPYKSYHINRFSSM